jgi:hypothetical protein
MQVGEETAISGALRYPRCPAARIAAREEAREIANDVVVSRQLVHRLFHKAIRAFSALFSTMARAIRRLTAPPARAKGSAPETGARRPPYEAM